MKLLCLALFLLGASSENTRYRLQYKILEDCPNPEQYPFGFSNYIKKTGVDTYEYSAMVNIPFDMGDELGGSVVVDVWGNGGWKYNFFKKVFKKNSCSLHSKFMPETIATLLEHSNFSNPFTCPVKKGNYYIDRYPLRPFSFEQIPVFPLGYYRGTVEVFDDKKKWMCKRFYFNSLKP